MKAYVNLLLIFTLLVGIDPQRIVNNIGSAIAYAKKSQPFVKLVGSDGITTVDVDKIDGKNYIQVWGTQAIESLRGYDPQADVWFYIGTEEDTTGAGQAGDTIRIQIAAGDDPSMYPAVDLTYTLVLEDEGSEETLSLNIANFLNTQPSFSSLWRAQRIAGNGVIYITARKPGGEYERENTNDFIVSATGSTRVTSGFDKIIRRNKITGLARDPVDPRQGQLGIQGSVTQSEGSVTNRFQTVYPDLNIRGDITPQVFRIESDPTEVKFISSVNISGRDNGIQFSNFLGLNGELDTGIQIRFKSNDITVTRAYIKTTDDLLDLHAEDPDNFEVFFASGADKFTAILEFGVPLELRPQGEYANNDYIEIIINDDLRSVTQLRAIVTGFNREF